VSKLPGLGKKKKKKTKKKKKNKIKKNKKKTNHGDPPVNFKNNFLDTNFRMKGNSKKKIGFLN